MALPRLESKGQRRDILSSLFMLSLADPTKYYQVVLSQGIGVGIALGLLLVPAYSIQAHHWKRRRALAMGAVSLGEPTSSSLNN